MPRLSLWNPRKGNDYKFIDKAVKAHFEHGVLHCLSINIWDHKTQLIQTMILLSQQYKTCCSWRIVIENMTITSMTYVVFIQLQTKMDLSQFGMFLERPNYLYTTSK